MSAEDDRTTAPGWQRVADDLKAHPPEPPSSFARDRMLRGIEAQRAGTTLERRSGTTLIRWAALGTICAGAAVALFVVLRAKSGSEAVEVPRIAVVEFEGIGDATAEIAQGGELRTAPGLVANAQVAGARLTAEGGSALRLSSLDPRDVRVALLTGSVRVTFHPSQQGDLVTIRTRDADVVVVGTVFRVQLAPEGTRVSVTEGRVRVIDRHGRETFATPGREVLVRDGSIASSPPPASGGAANPSEPVAVAAAAAATERPSAPSASAASARQSAAANTTRAAPPSETLDSRARRAARDVVSLPQGTAPAADRSVLAPPAPDVPARAETSSDPRARLAAARELLERGEHASARVELRAIASAAGPTGVRVEAWTLLAESHQSRGDARAAVELYERAAAVGRGTAAGGNARFAQARLLERRLGDGAGARAAYRRYLAEAPRGALRRSATEALCRLGDSEACASSVETEQSP